METCRIVNGFCTPMSDHKCLPHETQFEELKQIECMRKDARNVGAVNRHVYDDNIARASSAVQAKLTYARVRQIIRRAKDDIYPAKFTCRTRK